MVISNRQVPNLSQALKVQSTHLKNVESHKFLGVTIDNKLKFSSHISEIGNKISKSIGVMYRLSEFLPCESLLNIYYALVHSYLMYCNAIWGGTYISHLQPLIILQKKCIRIVFKRNYTAHTLPLFFSGKVLQIKHIHDYSLLTFFYKNFDLFLGNLPSHTHETRNSSYLIPTFQRLNICQRSIYFSAINLWNQFPLSLKTIDRYECFKTKYSVAFLGTLPCLIVPPGLSLGRVF